MDRKIMIKNQGFTIVELVLTMALIAVLLSFAVPTFKKQLLKYRIENDTKQIHALLQKVRSKAFTNKKSFTVTFENGASSDKTIVVKESSATIATLTLKTEFNFASGTIITVDSRGTFSGSSIYATDYDKGAQYDCIAISDIRVALGEWDATATPPKCNAK
jgi:prepilin-type N-terminal cleavage/methylation domain-containing protein